MYLAEKEAKELLAENGFDVLESYYLTHESEVREVVRHLGFPVVMKISGKKIVHKTKIGGVKLHLKSFEECLLALKEMRKIKGFEGVVIQEQVQGKSIFLGVKKTPEFGHAIAVGSGGTDVEEKKDITFRICPFDKKDAEAMLEEVMIGKELNSNEKKKVVDNLILLNKLVQKNPFISELDINPLVVNNKFAKIIDARALIKK